LQIYLFSLSNQRLRSPAEFRTPVFKTKLSLLLSYSKMTYIKTKVHLYY